MVSEMNQAVGGQALPPLSPKNRGEERVAGATALASSTGAVVASAACCVLPLALPAVVLAGAGGTLPWLAGAHGWITAISGLLVAAAWLIVWTQRRCARAKPARGTIYMLIAATLLLALALLWPAIEPGLVKALQ